MFLDEQHRSFMDHMRVEHRRLHKMLGEMRSAIASGDDQAEAPSFGHVVFVLQKLYEELKHHFAEEEAGGCLEEAVCLCPRLSAEAKRITCEHSEILDEVSGLIEQAKTLPANTKNRFAMGQELDRLGRRLQSHEAAENRLLSQGFGIAANDPARRESTESVDDF